MSEPDVLTLMQHPKHDDRLPLHVNGNKFVGTVAESFDAERLRFLIGLRFSAFVCITRLFLRSVGF